MSLFGSMMGDVEDDPFFGSHLRQMRHMNNMMNSLFSDPFGMMGGRGQMAIEGSRHGGPLMPFMPQMPPMNKLFSMSHGIPGFDGNMSAGSSFSSSTVVMSSGPGGKPQVYSSTSSTKIGPNGIKETRKTLQDSRTGTKKMSIGHHIGERAHVIAREQNVYSGDAEEVQEYINIEEDEAEEFDREFKTRAGQSATRPSLGRRAPLAIAAPPAAAPAPDAHSSDSTRRRERHTETNRELVVSRPSSRRPIRTTASPLTTSSSPSIREVYSAPHPRRHKPRPAHTHTPHSHSHSHSHQRHEH